MTPLRVVRLRVAENVVIALVEQDDVVGEIGVAAKRRHKRNRRLLVITQVHDANIRIQTLQFALEKRWNGFLDFDIEAEYRAAAEHRDANFAGALGADDSAAIAVSIQSR